MQNAVDSALSQGVYAELSVLIKAQALGKRLSLNPKHKALNKLSGAFVSPARGRGMEFDSVRQYQPGDDIRSIDWRVTARLGKTHTKQFREEQEKPVMIFLDQRQTMFFGSQTRLKSVQACNIAALLAWAAINRGDRVGALIGANNSSVDIRPKNQRKTVLSILHNSVQCNNALNIQPQTAAQPLSALLAELQRICKPGADIYLISDFHDYDDACQASIRKLSQHNRLMALQVFDPLELQLPNKGRLNISNGQTQVSVDASNKNFTQSYQDQASKQQASLKNSLLKLKTPVIPMVCHSNAFEDLLQFLGGK